MSDHDPAHVDVMARTLHQVECPPKSRPWSDAHQRVHRRRATAVLTCLAEAGYELTAKGGDQ